MNPQELNQELFTYIQNSPTSFHAVSTAASILEQNGFSQLTEHESWDLLPGGRYYVTRNASSLFAFRMPLEFSNTLPGFQIIATHSDSPSFKLKESPEMNVEGHYTKLNIEKYGGALLAPWFDRPLSIAGRIVLREENHITTRLVNLDKDLAMVTNLAIHMNRNANDGQAYQVQTDLLPIISGNPEDFSVRSLIAEYLHINEDSILSEDLYLYNRMPGCFWGAEEEFISAPRLDDLQCTFTSIKALTSPCHHQVITALAILDNEEVGSQSRQGACSSFLRDCLERISFSQNATPEEHMCALARSFLLSADNGHALHPNYINKSDPTHHPYLNDGVLLKYSANQKYTSDALTGGIFKLLCEQWNIPCQTFFNHSNQLGGSTLGNLSMSQVSIPTVDIGVPLLAMHSPYETGGTKDTFSLYQAMRGFYQTQIHLLADGSYRLEK